jgi:O-methyltransferase involved in polyketide biosynthesis
MSETAVELGGVGETTLWTLYHRAVEARRPDAVLDDPLAVELVERIQFPFAARFGDGSGLSQWQALRARCFDDAIRAFLRATPDGTVVALGEGLESQLWRVDNGRVHWVSVDLPEVVALRRRLLPEHPRATLVGRSVLDPAWTDELGQPDAVLLTAQGLLMYLPTDEVHDLVVRCAERFPRRALVFDAVPRWLAERSRRGKLRTPTGYEPPPWTWALDRDEGRRLCALPGVAALERLRLPRGRGLVHAWLLPLVSSSPGLRRGFFSVLRARFG